MTGIVFDIQRFALHDGPGIRTTVFLKGCPLTCLWCHNPESQAREPEVSYDREKCSTCPACAVADRSGVSALQAGPLAIEVGGDGAPTGACPHGAFTVVGEEMSVDRVMGEVMRDEAYYRRSGGGLTLSGGEPLFQFEFALALLREGRYRGLHTCLDTCGMASPRRMAAVAPYVDLFLFDYKATDSLVHAMLTGAPNELIVQNIEHLYRLGSRIRLRCPLVPGVNDSWEHLAAIARLSDRYPDLEGIEIMPYHDLGRDKARRIGREYALPDVPAADDEQVGSWLEALSQFGCTRAVAG